MVRTMGTEGQSTPVASEAPETGHTEFARTVLFDPELEHLAQLWSGTEDGPQKAAALTTLIDAWNEHLSTAGVDREAAVAHLLLACRNLSSWVDDLTRQLEGTQELVRENSDAVRAQRVAISVLRSAAGEEDPDSLLLAHLFLGLSRARDVGNHLSIDKRFLAAIVHRLIDRGLDRQLLKRALRLVRMAEDAMTVEAMLAAAGIAEHGRSDS